MTVDLTGRTALVTGASSGIGAALTGVSVHLEYPAIIDTELFDIPGNDPLPDTGVEALPPTAVVDAILAQLDGGSTETWVRPMSADIYASKAENLQGFVEGSAAFWQARPRAAGRNSRDAPSGFPHRGGYPHRRRRRARCPRPAGLAPVLLRRPSGSGNDEYGFYPESTGSRASPARDRRSS